jgi:enoyl-CoA hydratase/carnithine racemase
MRLLCHPKKERNPMSEFLLAETQGRVLRLTLNRPEKRNALSSDLCRDLVDAVYHADRDHRIGVILLAANGPAYCAGMDLQEALQVRPESLSNVHEQLFTMGSRIGKPMVTAVKGAALGGGMGLVANCHIVVASQEAKFGLTEIRLGVWPFLVFQAVQLALGERRAVELALTGRIFDVAEAKTLSLVQEIVEDPEARAMEIAEGLAASSPAAIGSGLQFVQEARGKDLDTASLIARRVREELMGSGDFREGLRAFLEKRKPVWPSREG